MINQAGSGYAVDGCAEKSGIPIGQDDDDGTLWLAMDGKYNSVSIISQEGILVHKIYPSSFPASEGEILDVVAGLLQ
jgi:hypothetical protein